MMRFRWAIIGLVLFSLFSWKADCYAIIDGNDAAEDEFPWAVGIIKKGFFSSPALVGGGALLGNQWVVTAAHTLDTESASSIQVWLGMESLSDSSSRIVRNVLAIYRHPDFAVSNDQSVNDVAILLLDSPVTNIAPLPVNGDAANVVAGDDLTVMGWGTIQAGVFAPTDALQKAPARLLDLAVANGILGGTPLTNVHLAAKDPSNISTPCFGDSGSPLIKQIGGVDTLVGVVSFGSAECDNAALPSVYVNIAEVSDWINGYLGLTQDSPNVTVTGKSRLIRDNDRSPRKADGTYFGKFSRKSKKRHRTFRVQGNTDGLLTVRRVYESSKRFSMRRRPSTVIGAGSSASFSVSFKPPRHKGRFQTYVTLLTNDLANPVYRFRIRGRTK